MERSELVRRMVLGGRSGDVKGMPPVDVVEEDFETYFYRTEKGLDLHLSDDSWRPFDEEGNPLKE